MNGLRPYETIIKAHEGAPGAMNKVLSLEQNTNQIDGIINNLPAPPPLPVLPAPVMAL